MSTFTISCAVCGGEITLTERDKASPLTSVRDAIDFLAEHQDCCQDGAA